MSNREDYLDSLLKSVTGPEETGREAEAESQRNQSGKAEGKRSVSPLSEDDQFLANYDQELLDLDEDAFLREFEEELSGKAIGTSGKKTAVSDQLSEDMDDLMVNTMDEDDLAGVEYDRGLEKELLKGDDPLDNAEPEDTFADGLFGEDAFMDSGFMDSADGEAEDADDIDAMLKAAMSFGDDESKAAPKEEAQAGEDPELMDILSGMGGNDDLEDIGNMLKAHDEDAFIEDDGFDEIAGELSGQIEELGVTSGLGLDPDFVKDMKEKGKRGKKKKKKEKKPGVFSKFASTLFDEKEESVTVPEASELGSVSEENMNILKELDKKEKKEKKKQEKLEKKQAKQEKKAQAKQEKPPKPPKEKKPKQKSKPLPRKPVILIYVMVASILLLIFLSSSLSGYRTGIDQAKASYDSGDYVKAYQSLMGMELKEKDQKFYDRAKMAAFMQKEWSSYEAFLGQEMYPEALDALILAVGKYDKYIEKATQVGADGELEGVRVQVEAALTDVFGVTAEEARTVYGQPDRGAYTAQLYELLGRAGLAE